MERQSLGLWDEDARNGCEDDGSGWNDDGSGCEDEGSGSFAVFSETIPPILFLPYFPPSFLPSVPSVPSVPSSPPPRGYRTYSSLNRKRPRPRPGTDTQALTFMLKDGEEGEARVEEHDGVGDEVPLVLHLEDRDKDARRGVRAPGDDDRDGEVPDPRVEGDEDVERREEDEREEAVPQHRRHPVRVDPGRGHQVEEEVDREVAEEGDPVDVSELRFPGLVGGKKGGDEGPETRSRRANVEGEVG